MTLLNRSFYEKDAITVAKSLLGKKLVHEINGYRISGTIVETEAYMGVADKASHAYGNRRTARTEVMYGEPGLSYVFQIYGMHFCFNVVTKALDVPHAVLIRGLEPCEGIEQMAINRFGKSYEMLSKTQFKNLTNGPGKLCKALAITKAQNNKDLLKTSSNEMDTLFIEESDDTFQEPFETVSTKRIGIDYAEEAKEYPWRFYIRGNPNVSISEDT